MSGILGLPNVKVEFAPTATPDTASPTWVDISSRMRLADGLTCSRGRSDERATAQPGLLDLTVNNDDGDFTPGLNSGAYHPLTVNTPIRVSVHNGTSYVVIWTGLIDEFEPAWVNGKRAVCRVGAVDRLTSLQNRELGDWETETHRVLAPTQLWPLTDPEDSATAGEVASGQAGSFLSLESIGSAASDTFAFAGGSPIEGSTVASFAPSSGSVGHVLNHYGDSLATTTLGHSLSCLVLTDTSEVRVVFLIRDDFWNVIKLEITAAGTARVVVRDGLTPADLADVTGTTTVTNGVWHQIGCTVAHSGGTVTLTLFVDGVAEATDTYSASSVWDLPNTQVGGYAPYLFDGWVAQACVWRDRTPSAAWMAEAHKAITGAEGETTTARFERLCGYAGVLCDTTGTGSSTMGVQSIAGRPTLDALEECATAELSTVTVTGAGAAAMTARTERYTPATALSVTADEVGKATAFLHSADDVVNSVVASRPSGPSVNVTDEASVAVHGTREITLEVNVNTDEQLTSLAEWTASVNAEPGARVDRLDLDPWIKQARMALTSSIALDVGDKLVVTGLPDEAPADEVGLIVEGITDEFGVEGWRRRLNTSPSRVWDQVFTVEDDTLGRVGPDPDSITLNAALNSSATSVVVNTAAGSPPLTNADLPFDIDVDGERITVTAVSAATSPQTLTITRGVAPSTAAAHDSGAVVNLWKPGRLAA